MVNFLIEAFDHKLALISIILAEQRRVGGFVQMSSGMNCKKVGEKFIGNETKSAIVMI